jgi:hypothetical protein
MIITTKTTFAGRCLPFLYVLLQQQQQKKHWCTYVLAARDFNNAWTQKAPSCLRESGVADHTKALKRQGSLFQRRGGEIVD